MTTQKIYVVCNPITQNYDWIETEQSPKQFTFNHKWSYFSGFEAIEQAEAFCLIANEKDWMPAVDYFKSLGIEIF